MIDHTHLETILAVEREGSLEAAANKLNVTSAAVSRRMRTLEDRIGATLLVRDGKATPTRMGLQVCRFAEAVEQMERDVLRFVSTELAEGRASSPQLRVIVDHDSLTTWFVDVLEADSGSNDLQFLDLMIRPHDHSLNPMRDGQALAAISTVQDPLHGHRNRFLGTHTFRAVATHTFVRRWFPDGPTLDAVLAAPALSYGIQDALPDLWLKKAFGRPVPILTHVVPCSRTSVLACQKNVGWAMAPSQIADPLLRANELVEVIPGTSLDRPLYWHFSVMAEKAIQPVTRLVMQAAVRHLGQAGRDGESGQASDTA